MKRKRLDIRNLAGIRDVFWIDVTDAGRIVFFVVLALLVAERIASTFRRRTESKKTVKSFHRHFFYLLLASYLTIITVGSIQFFRRSEISILVSSVGALILITGVFCRREAIRALNGDWSVFIEIKENQRLVREGIYRYLKHPYYTAVVLELIGFSLLCNAYGALLLTFAVQVPLLLIRIHFEDRILNVYGRRLRFLP